MDEAHEHSQFGSIAASILAPVHATSTAEPLPTSGEFGTCSFVTLASEFASVEFIGVGVALIALTAWALSHEWLTQFEIFLLLLVAPVVEVLVRCDPRVCTFHHVAHAHARLLVQIFFGEACLVYSAGGAWAPFALVLLALWSNVEVVLVQIWLYDLVSPCIDSEVRAGPCLLVHLRIGSHSHHFSRSCCAVHCATRSLMMGSGLCLIHTV